MIVILEKSIWILWNTQWYSMLSLFRIDYALFIIIFFIYYFLYAVYYISMYEYFYLEIKNGMILLHVWDVARNPKRNIWNV